MKVTFELARRCVLPLVVSVVAIAPTAGSDSPLIRVGLATDLASLDVPCCSAGLIAEASGQVVARIESLRIEPRAEILSPSFYRVQVAALKDESQAFGLAEQIGRLARSEADVVFDAGIDLYRVRVGRFPARPEAEQLQKRLATEGVSESWIVTEQGDLGATEFRLIQGQRVTRVPGRWLKLRSDSDDTTGVRVLGAQYRGSILVYLNSRGLLNVINELTIEDYLRGVVPKEMGPAVYDQLEALKAQSVAARTYTLRNLGEFLDEGYDICATPRCQVYGGMNVEHPLSDRAIAETAGEVMTHSGELIEALYSSTCGGHTENVELIFPLKRAAYLRGVPCLEAGVDGLNGEVHPGVRLAVGLMRNLLPPAANRFDAASVGRRFEDLAVLAGLPIPSDRLESLERREVQRFIASIYDLALDVRLFVAAEDLPYLIDRRPADWSERDLRLAAYLVKSGLLAGSLDEPLTEGEVEETLLRLAIHLQVLQYVEGRYQGATASGISIRGDDGELETFDLASGMGSYRVVDGEPIAGSLGLLAGDSIEIYLRDREVRAVVHEANRNGVSFDRTSRRSSWSRFHSDGELSRLVQDRYPGLGFRGFEILERGVSGRVGRIRIDGDQGKSVEVEGLAVRWTLDIPDTLFTAKRLQPPDRPSGWLFTGRGWGHGVGMCQVGAFGMGQRGHSYREILDHYYTGIDVVRREQRDQTGKPAAR